MLLGFFLNQQLQGWELRSFDILGWLCIWLGVFLVFVSVLGMNVSRSDPELFNLPLIAYFMVQLLVASMMLLTVIWVLVENHQIGSFLAHHWEEVKRRIGVDSITGDELTFKDVLHLLHMYLTMIAVFGLTTFCVLLVTLVAVARLLGVRPIAMSFLTVLGILGAAQVLVGWYTYGKVPSATTWLLLGCACVQVLCSAAGMCGFRRLNRECVFWSFTILLISGIFLAFVSASTYAWLRNTAVQVPASQSLCPRHLSRLSCQMWRLLMCYCVQHLARCAEPRAFARRFRHHCFGGFLHVLHHTLHRNPLLPATF